MRVTPLTEIFKVHKTLADFFKFKIIMDVAYIIYTEEYCEVIGQVRNKTPYYSNYLTSNVNQALKPFSKKISLSNVYIRDDWQEILTTMWNDSHQAVKYVENPKYRLVFFGAEKSILIESKSQDSNLTKSPFDCPRNRQNAQSIDSWRIGILASELWCGTSFQELDIADQWRIINGEPAKSFAAQNFQKGITKMPINLIGNANNRKWWDKDPAKVPSLETIYQTARGLVGDEHTRLKAIADAKDYKAPQNMKWEILYQANTIPITDLAILNVDLENDLPMGGGGFCNVYFGNNVDGSPVAVKVIKPEKMKDYNLVHELEISKKLFNPRHGSLISPEYDDRQYLVMTYNILKSQGNIAIVMQYIGPNITDEVTAGNSSLRDQLDMQKSFREDKLIPENQQIFSKDQQIKIALDVAKGLRYMHSREIIHGDIKGANILLDNLDHIEHLLAKICDFGSSYDVKRPDNKPPTGTPAWKPKELYEGQTPTPASDVYSYGMLLIELVTGEVPCANNFEAEAWIRNGDYEKLVPTPDCIFKDIINGCRKLNPNERMSLDTIIEQLTALQKPTLSEDQAWDLDPAMLAEAQKSPEKLIIKPLTQNEARFIVKSYQECARPGYEPDLARCQSVYSYALYPLFFNQLDKFSRISLEEKKVEQDDPTTAKKRSDLQKKFEATVKTFLKKLPNGTLIKLRLLCHATSNEQVATTISKTGYANLRKLDEGYIGAANYTTPSFDYARVYGNFFIWNLACVFNIRYIVEKNWRIYKGQGAFGNCDAHVVEVFPTDPGNKQNMDYHPGLEKGKPQFEVALFHWSNLLPRFFIKLRKMQLPKQIMLEMKEDRCWESDDEEESHKPKL